MTPTPPTPERIPEVCRREILDWDSHVRHVAERVLGMLCEGLGVGPSRLEEMTCLGSRMMVCHYYPRCPQPDLTLGLNGHTDPGVLTVLVQNEVAGLQLRKKNGQDGDTWVQVEPVPGAIVINVGDLLQMISNDEYRSVDHRVVANPHEEPRVSIAVFFNPSNRDESTYYGPLPELVTEEKPARYREFTVSEYMKAFFSKELESSLVDQFRL